MPNLRALSIIAEPGIAPYRLPILSGGMPHLESISLSLFSYGDQVVQLTQLTEVNITVQCSTLTDVVRLFANNPKLRSATLCGLLRNQRHQQQHGAVRMDFLRQLDLISWSASSLLPFLTLNKGAHIRVFGLTTILEKIGGLDLFPSDTKILPNLVGLKQLHWYFTTHDTLMEFTGPNGGFSILLPQPEVHVFSTDSLPLGEVEELYCEFGSTPGLVTGTDESNRIVASMVPTMNQLRKVTFAMCTNSLVQAILSNLNPVAHLKYINLSHCDHPDPTHEIFHALLLFAKGRKSMDAKLEEIRVVCRAPPQRPGFLDLWLSQVVKSFVLVHQSPSEARRTNIEIRRDFPASIRKTYSLHSYIPVQTPEGPVSILLVGRAPRPCSTVFLDTKREHSRILRRVAVRGFPGASL